MPGLVLNKSVLGRHTSERSTLPAKRRFRLNLRYGVYHQLRFICASTSSYDGLTPDSLGPKDQRYFEELLTLRFPSIAGALTEIERGLLQVEMAAFARATRNAIESDGTEEWLGILLSLTNSLVVLLQISTTPSTSRILKTFSWT
jgi:hypothetical protein